MGQSLPVSLLECGVGFLLADEVSKDVDLKSTEKQTVTLDVGDDDEWGTHKFKFNGQRNMEDFMIDYNLHEVAMVLNLCIRINHI